MKPTYDEIKRLFGDLNEHTILEIQNSGVTMPELQEVSAFLAREDDVMGELHRTLSGGALEVYEVLRRLDARWEEDR